MISLYKLTCKHLTLYENSKSVALTSRSLPGMGISLSKTVDLYLPPCQIYMKFTKFTKGLDNIAM